MIKGKTVLNFTDYKIIRPLRRQPRLEFRTKTELGYIVISVECRRLNKTTIYPIISITSGNGRIWLTIDEMKQITEYIENKAMAYNFNTLWLHPDAKVLCSRKDAQQFILDNTNIYGNAFILVRGYGRLIKAKRADAGLYCVYTVPFKE